MTLSGKLSNLAESISEGQTLKSVRRGLMLSMPLILIGSFCVLFLNLPIPALQNFLNEVFGDYWRQLFLRIHEGTFQIMSLFSLISISYSYLSNSPLIKDDNINPIIPTLVVFGCYYCFMCDPGDSIVSLSKYLASATGLFQVILISIIGSKLFLFFFKFKPLRLKVLTNDADMVLAQTLSVLLASLFTLATFAIVRVITKYFGIDVYYNELYSSITQKAYNGNMFVAALLFDIISNFLWFFGIHGTNVLEAFNRDVFVKATEFNMQLHAAGMPPTEIFTKQFFDIFVFMGGCGTTLALIIVLMFKANKSNTDKIAKFSILPALFNINELIVYGLPIILNPFFFLPFIFTPVVLTFTTYAAMRLGLVPLTVNEVGWTTPIILGGYLATESFAGSILQIFNLFLGILIYLPFVKMFESHKQKESLKLYRQLVETITYIKAKKYNDVIDRTDEIGYFARTLAKDIANDVTRDSDALWLEYQPKVNIQGKVTSCEALLRYLHPKYGQIPPPVVLTLSDEAGLTTELGSWVLKTAVAEKARLERLGLGGISLSVNVVEEQIKAGWFSNFLENLVELNGINPKELELEFTENMMIDYNIIPKDALKKIREMGIELSIDDFGMGHSSLLYIRDFSVNTVKIDGSLVRDIFTDTNCQEIISSIVSLCNMLNLKLVAECVETEEQRDKLFELGCEVYQGYLYSRPLTADNLIKYIFERNGMDDKAQ